MAHGNYVAYSEPFVKDMVEAGLWNEQTIEFIMMDNGSIRYLDKFVRDHPNYFSEELYTDGNLKDEVLKKIKHLQNIHRGMYEISQKGYDADGSSPRNLCVSVSIFQYLSSRT